MQRKQKQEVSEERGNERGGVGGGERAWAAEHGHPRVRGEGTHRKERREEKITRGASVRKIEM
jgi:hypothetical protein